MLIYLNRFGNSGRRSLDAPGVDCRRVARRPPPQHAGRDPPTRGFTSSIKKIAYGRSVRELTNTCGQ